MKVRHVLAGILVTFGILFLLGAVGNGDFYGYMVASDYINVGVGAAMIAAAVPIGNVGRDEDNENHSDNP